MNVPATDRRPSTSTSSTALSSTSSMAASTSQLIPAIPSSSSTSTPPQPSISVNSGSSHSRVLSDDKLNIDVGMGDDEAGPSRSRMVWSPKEMGSFVEDLKQEMSVPSRSRSVPVTPRTSISALPRISRPSPAFLRPPRSPSAPSSPRIQIHRGPSPIPDYIDTGVKGTPPPTRPPSPPFASPRSMSKNRLDGPSARPSNNSLHIRALSGDIPCPTSDEQGLVEKGRCAPSDTEEPEPTWPPWRSHSGWARWRNESIVTPNLVPALVIQAFAAGILDATTYADFKTFASNQTGNTILLTVSIIGSIEVLLLLTGVSLAAFLTGAFVFGHIGHYMGVRRRIWILTSTIYQILALIVAAILVSPSGPSVTQVGGKHDWVIIVLFANMSGCQVAMARQSGSQELPTAPMTSSYVDLMADKYLFVGINHPKAGPRNRRVAYLGAMIIGGFIGSTIHRYAGSYVVVIVTVALKLAVFGLVCVTRAEVPKVKT